MLDCSRPSLWRGLFQLRVPFLAEQTCSECWQVSCVLTWGWGPRREVGCVGDLVEVAQLLWVTCGSLSPGLDSESASSSIRFSKACLKNVFSVLLILIYLLLMAVAVFLVYQTITDFREKLKHPVMSVSYKEVDRYDAPGRACRVRWWLADPPELPLHSWHPPCRAPRGGGGGVQAQSRCWLPAPEMPSVPSRVSCAEEGGGLSLEWSLQSWGGRAGLCSGEGFELGFGRWKGASLGRGARAKEGWREVGAGEDEPSLAESG